MQQINKLILASMLVIFAGNSYAETTVPIKKNHPHKKHHVKKVSSSTSEPESNVINIPETTQSTDQATKEEDQQQPLTAQFTITSNYVFRGVSQSSNLPAIQGGITYTFFTPGIYFNLWGSNINFQSPDGSQATVEFDTVVGIKNSFINDDLTYNLSFSRYNYPKSASSYNELIGILSYKILFVTAAYSSNAYNLHSDSHYYSVGINYNIPPEYIFGFNDVNFIASMGHYSLPLVAGSSYNDYLLQFTKKIVGAFSGAILWTGTNGKSNTGASGDNHLIASVIVDV